MKVLFITLILLTFSQVQAQPATGVIRGVITADSSGTPIANATIALIHTPFVTQTDVDGAYRLTGIPAGVYQLRITARGYSRWLYYDLTVPENIPLVFSLRLKGNGGDTSTINTFRLRPLPSIQQDNADRMLFYQPDSTIDFKLRIVNPEKSPDSSATKRK